MTTVSAPARYNDIRPEDMGTVEWVYSNPNVELAPPDPRSSKPLGKPRETRYSPEDGSRVATFSQCRAKVKRNLVLHWKSDKDGDICWTETETREQVKRSAGVRQACDPSQPNAAFRRKIKRPWNSSTMTKSRAATCRTMIPKRKTRLNQATNNFPRDKNGVGALSTQLGQTLSKIGTLTVSNDTSFQSNSRQTSGRRSSRRANESTRRRRRQPKPGRSPSYPDGRAHCRADELPTLAHMG